MLVAKHLDRARVAVKMQARVRRALGDDAEWLLRAILANRLSFRNVAAIKGRPSKRGAARVAVEFREALKGLARVFIDL
jgi:hypothetical protein